jgi:signal transduction histidine kinase
VFGASDTDAELVFSVADTGPGIPADLRERIFYPFFTTKQRGSGVGLALAQKIVAGHGGRLELESESGAGATFRVRIPLPGATP